MLMNNLTLKQLRYFEAVARIGHFGRAAEACAISQPALSMQIRELEAHLGQTLIERLPSGLRLTRVGQEVGERAAQILAQVSDLAEYARMRAAPLSGVLSLGIIPTVAPYVLPALLARLRRDFPALQLKIRESQTDNLLRGLAAGSLDLLLLALPIKAAGLKILPLFEDRFLLAAPDHFVPPPGPHRLPEILQAAPILLLEEGHCLRDQALSFCALRDVETVERFGASNLTTILQMVASGMGVTLLPEMAVAVEMRNQGVQIRRLAAPEPSRTIALAWRKSSPREADFNAFGDVVLEARNDARADIAD